MPFPLPSIDFDLHIVWRFLFNSLIIEGARTTLIVAVLAQALGVALGVVSALMRMSKNPLISGPANFYVWFFRGTPLLLTASVLVQWRCRSSSVVILMSRTSSARSALPSLGWR